VEIIHHVASGKYTTPVTRLAIIIIITTIAKTVLIIIIVLFSHCWSALP
jgi:hypothetical protein